MLTYLKKMLDPIYRLDLNHPIPKCFENLKPAFTGSNSVLKQSNIILKFSSKLKKKCIEIVLLLSLIPTMHWQVEQNDCFLLIINEN